MNSVINNNVNSKLVDMFSSVNVRVFVRQHSGIMLSWTIEKPQFHKLFLCETILYYGKGCSCVLCDLIVQKPSLRVYTTKPQIKDVSWWVLEDVPLP